MKPKILALYYTQSGQIKEILDNIFRQVDAEIVFANLEPEKPFPFPWNAYAFFDAMPETVERIPIAMKPLPYNLLDQHYDLVILGYQPWFLNPSQPITSFLKSNEAAFLKGKNIITVIGCRNMWLHAQEEVKKDLKELGANLVGNIVLTDSYPNLISTLTVIRWAFTGKKQASGLLPAAGVQQKDIEAAEKFGKPIQSFLQGNKNLQEKLLHEGAVKLKPGLIILEQRAIRNFKKFAPFIRQKGGPGDLNRKGRVLLFKRLLLVGIFILSPISSFTAFIQLQMKKRKLTKDLDYFRNISFEEKRI
ncbi:MAG: dialkylresorcinol condensing enzyme DarA [Bacteroidetes bacterium]|nr:dialkylresorcinol condensing enzyme DarA [Bacteroidota bacterium]MBS1741360.1 dialkylresorcinol condensing enzyme DarA [Bacteroidota bacterium]